MADKRVSHRNDTSIVQLFKDMNDGTFLPVNAGNLDTGALVTHASAAVGVNGADQLNVNSRGLQVGVNITAGSGTTPTLQIIVEGKDTGSGVYYTIFASTAIAAAASFTLLSVYPGLTASMIVGNQLLPRTWRVRTVIGGVTPAVTATVSASVII